jgi:hypothetical protein
VQNPGSILSKERTKRKQEKRKEKLRIAILNLKKIILIYLK